MKTLIARMKLEILADVREGLVPVNVASFSELHDYCDANAYGGLCVDDVLDSLIESFGGRDQGQGMPQGLLDHINACQTAIHEWISSGRMLEAAEEQFGSDWLGTYGDQLRQAKRYQRIGQEMAGVLSALGGDYSVLAAKAFKELK